MGFPPPIFKPATTVSNNDLLQFDGTTGFKVKPLAIGNEGQQLAVVSSALTYTNPLQAGFNYVINGNFDYWQRGSTISAAGLIADRFREDRGGSTIVASRQATAGTEAFNAKYFHRTVVTSVAGSGNYALMEHRLEGVRRFSGKTFTLSFWAKADATKNIAISLAQSFGTGGSPSAAVGALGVTTINLTSSWAQFSVVVDIPSISGKTLGTNGDDYTTIFFWLDAGSTFNVSTNSLGQQSGTFDIAQIKFEDGPAKTPFIVSGGTMAADLLNCKRFYQKSYSLETDPGTDTTVNFVKVLTRATGSTTTGTNSIGWEVEFRATPTVATYPKDGSVVDTVQFNSSASATNEVAPDKSVDSKRMRIGTSAASGLTAGNAVEINFHYTASAEL